MKGKILDFNIQDGQGIISADNDNRYSFSVGDWKSSESPEVGQVVDFEIVDKQIKEIYKAPNQGWSWLGFFFAPAYYAGYGNLKAGLIMAVLTGIMPLIGILVGLYGGWHANRELPVNKIEFDWKNAGIAFLTAVVISIISYNIINS